MKLIKFEKASEWFKGDLSKTEEGGKHQAKIVDVSQHVRALWTRTNRSKDPAQKQLSRIEEKLDNLVGGRGSMNHTRLDKLLGGRSSMNQTWAGGAAQGERQVDTPLSQRTAVRVRLPDSQGKSSTELQLTLWWSKVTLRNWCTCFFANSVAIMLACLLALFFSLMLQ